MSGRPTPAFASERLTVRLGGRTVLHELDLTARRGELLALTGPNGSGKTTLLRSALGLVTPTRGEVRLLGEATRSLAIRERARRVAWMPQEEAAFENVPLFDYVLFGRYAHLPPFSGEGPADRAAAEAALREVGLWEQRDRGILEVSGGERQRVLLARAVAQDTPILLLDEPTAHLDIGHQLDLLERVRRFCRERDRCAIAALHDLNLAARYADRVAVLSRGRLVADGPPGEVLSEALLREVWGVVAELRRDPVSGLPYLLPRLPDRSAGAPAPRRTPPIHVVGGGGAAAPVLRAHVEDGQRVTTGALPLFDTDLEVAEELGLPSASEVPFAPLGPQARQEHRALLDEAGTIVVAPFAVGPSNLANLEDLLGRAATIPVYLIETTPIATRDFTGGRATALRDRLVAEGARSVPDLPALRAALARRGDADR